ncbi:MAG: hypothetical protein JO288_06350 [Hyphomicrobiales bacterium]|nr:hypothetical protein [Hyphomicrobiales bacterium]
MVHSPDSWMMREELRAQLAPLNRYGMAGSIAGAVDGLRALARSLARALCQALCQAPGASSDFCGCKG